MTSETLKEKIINAVTASESDGMDKKTISTSTSVKGIVLEGAIARLVKDKILKVEEKEGQKIYFVSPADTQTEGSGTEINEPIAALEKKGNQKSKKGKVVPKVLAEVEEKDQPRTKKGKSEGRDMRKFKFQGELYNKGALVHAVISAYVKKHPQVTLGKLKEIWPDELLARFGVFQELSKCRQMTSGGRDRYCLQDEKIIKLKDKRIGICNQWTASNIQSWLKTTRKLGYDIK